MKIEEVGCSNHGCLMRDESGGQGTNMICRCVEDLAQTPQGIQVIKRRIKDLQKRVKAQKPITITDDPATWPEMGKRVLLECKGELHIVVFQTIDDKLAIISGNVLFPALGFHWQYLPEWEEK